VILARKFSEKKGNLKIVKRFFSRRLWMHWSVLPDDRQINVFLKTRVSGN
jgi:hypothetical protein